MKSQRLSLFIHENVSSFQYIKGKMLPHQNVNFSFNNLPDRTVTARVSKLAFCLFCSVVFLGRKT